MPANELNKSTDRGFDPTAPSMAKAPFRGVELRGLQAFGWFGAAHKGVTVRHRVVDHRTLSRPRRDV
jgi:hypothetical protein